MLIEQINKNTVKIHISGVEMKDFNVDYNTIKNNPETENMLAVLMDVIDDSTDIETKGETFFIEAYEQKEDNGCILFISSISENGVENLSEIYGLTDVTNLTEKTFDENELEYFIFKTTSKQILFDIANILFVNYGDYINNSLLYELNGEYRLIFEYRSEVRQEIAISLLEFGDIPEEIRLSLALTYEYFNCIIENNALNNIVNRVNS